MKKTWFSEYEKLNAIKPKPETFNETVQNKLPEMTSYDIRLEKYD